VVSGRAFDYGRGVPAALLLTRARVNIMAAGILLIFVQPRRQPMRA